MCFFVTLANRFCRNRFVAVLGQVEQPQHLCAFRSSPESKRGAFAYMARHLLANQGDMRFNGRLVLFRNFFNVNLHGEDELIIDGVYLHTRGLTGRNAMEFTTVLQSILKNVRTKRGGSEMDTSDGKAQEDSFQILGLFEGSS